MAARIRHLIPAEGWFAVYARATGPARDTTGSPRSGIVGGPNRGGPAPEFLPLVGWAVIADDSDANNDRIVGVLVHDNLSPELVLPDDPSFLGYAGPGDPGIDRVRLAPDWRAMAKQAIADLKGAPRR